MPSERAPQHTTPVTKAVRSSRQATKTKVAATQVAAAQKPKPVKEPLGATLDPEFITFDAWIEKVEDVHYKEPAEDRNLEFGQTRTQSTTETNIYKRDIMQAPAVHSKLLGIMSFPHGRRKYVNGGQHLVEAVPLIKEEHAGMKLKPWMYKFCNKLMRVCLCVGNTRDMFKQGHTTWLICNRLIHRPTYANFWLVFIT